MARLFTSGFESGTLAGESLALIGTAAAFATDRVRTGALSMKPVATSAESEWEYDLNGVAGRNYYWRGYFQIDALSGSGASFIPLTEGSAHDYSEWFGVGIYEDGAVGTISSSGNFSAGSSSSGLFAVDLWHRLEVRVKMVTAGNDELQVKLNGTTVVGPITAAHGTLPIRWWGWGAPGGSGSPQQLWFDDIAINDDQSASNNSWVGGFQIARPDADTVTTGWTTTPLHSKLSDQSDATVITATLV